MTGEEWGDGTSDALVRVALGEEPPDTVVADATVFDAVTGEFTPGRSVWVKDGRIARVVEASESIPPGAETLDASGLTLVPGLMDGHTHTIHLFIPEFVRALLPTGVTSPVIEAMEYGATEGFAGVRLLVDALRDQPLRPFYTAPALCGLTEEEEVSPLTPAELDELLADPLCLGLGEVYWNNALLPGPQGRRAYLVAVPAPEEFRPIFVMVGGKLVFDRGEVLAEPRPVSVPAELLHTVGVDPERALEWAGPRLR